jgi:putative ABC transport system permease protein
MRTPLAWLNLWHEKGRTATALAGTAFAVVLVLLQLGFFKSTLFTATILYDQLDFDVVITSVRYRQMLKTGFFDKQRLTQAAELPEIRNALPLSVSLQLYRNPETGKKRSILLVGVDPRRHYVKVVTPEQMETILQPNHVIMDVKSRPEYGPRYVGLESEVGDRRVKVTGLFELGCGFGADGTVVTSDETFANFFFPRTINQISLGLLQLQEGTDIDATVAKLRQTLPDDVVIQSRAEFLGQEETYWTVKTSVGIIFGMGVIVALMVGTAIVYQVLAADIAKRMPEYATLKAMGYSSGYLSGVILTQAAAIGAIGFIPGWIIAIGLYAVTRELANIRMEMGLIMPCVVFVLSVLMCCVSGLASLRKVHSAAPAELFT